MGFSISLPHVSLPHISLPKLPDLPSIPNPLARIPGSEYLPARAPSADEVQRNKAALAAKHGGQLPVRTVTFNTAVGNPDIKTSQADFPRLPFYRDVIEGRPDAPIVALQEVGPEQAAALKRAAASGKFSMVYAKARPEQGNVLLIPNRYQVTSQRSKPLMEGQVKGIAQGIWSRVTGDESGSPLDPGQVVEPRMFSEAQLVDRYTGKRLTVFNAHLSANDPLQIEQGKELFSAVHAAEARGPVILGGDLNTVALPTPGTASDQVKDQFGDMKDMGATKIPGGRSNIDWVLADGFDSGTSRIWRGSSLHLPGSPNADRVSDHYAEDDVFTFARR